MGKAASCPRCRLTPPPTTGSLSLQALENGVGSRRSRRNRCVPTRINRPSTLLPPLKGRTQTVTRCVDAFAAASRGAREVSGRQGVPRVASEFVRAT